MQLVKGDTPISQTGDALSFACDHLQEIEADLAADDEATVKAQDTGGKSAR